MKVKLKPLIGWREWGVLPQLSLIPIKMKVDTGAKTSSLHAENIELSTRGKKMFVSFRIYPLQRDRSQYFECRLPCIDTRWVKSSVGEATLRPVVKTTIQMGDHAQEIEVTLVNRDLMGFRMLLGREAIKGVFSVDVSRSFMLGQKPATLKRKKI